MNIQSDLAQEYSIQTSGANESLVFEKLDDFINTLSKSDISKEKAKQIQRRFEDALSQVGTGGERISPFIKLDEKTGSSREELLDDFDMLLASNPLDSKISKKYLSQGRTVRTLLAIVGFTLIFLGVAAIIMPAPTYLHVANNDGLTIKDIFASVIMFSGVYMLLKFSK